MTITPAALAVMRVDVTAARQCVNEARARLAESKPLLSVCVQAEILALHVERLTAEVERMNASRTYADAPCPGSRGW